MYMQTTVKLRHWLEITAILKPCYHKNAYFYGHTCTGTGTCTCSIHLDGCMEWGTHSLHAFGLNVVGSKVDVIDVNGLHCHLHARVRVVTDKHLHAHTERGRERGREGERETVVHARPSRQYSTWTADWTECWPDLSECATTEQLSFHPVLRGTHCTTYTCQK